MRHLSFNIILLFVLLQVSACKKENTNSVTETSADYYPTTKGSYWIYETYYEDSKNNTTGISDRDTIIAEGDTVVCGGKAAYLKATPKFMFLRTSLTKDSAGSIINACSSGKTDYYPILDIERKGDTLFKGITDFNQIDRTVFMRGTDTTLMVPAGSFKCAVMQQNLKILASGNYEEIPPLFDCYAKGVGLVMRKIYFSNLPEKQYYVRLVEYHIQK